ncbi:hypothetical protein [Mycoplasma leonicaptivi]|nr:hypothetical protein [Mycoplasma leonicaptivi]
MKANIEIVTDTARAIIPPFDFEGFVFLSSGVWFEEGLYDILCKFS